MPKNPLIRTSTKFTAATKSPVVGQRQPIVVTRQPTESVRKRSGSVITAAGPAAATRKPAARKKSGVEAAVGKVGAAGTSVSQPGRGVGNVGDITTQPPSVSVQFTRKIIRPRDLLVLDFTFVNLKVTTAADGKLQLVRTANGKASYLVVGFPPQHLLEQAFFETADNTPIEDLPNHPPDPDIGINKEIPENKDIPVKSRLAEPSRLVFKVPANFTALPYTLDDVLDACRKWELSVVPSATPPDPRRMFPGTESAFSEGIRTSPSISAVKVGAKTKATSLAKRSTRSASSRTSAAKYEASRALTAATIAQTRDQWYAQRSPLMRGAASAGAVAEVSDILDKMKIIPKLVAPSPTQTAIEAPTRLILSPNSYGAWVHATEPVESAKTGRVELWHTRLAVRGSDGVTEDDDFRRAVRAIWSPDVFADDAFHEYTHNNIPFRAPLDAFDRHQLVHLSANHQLSKKFKPLPIDVDRMMLSSLGSWLNIHGKWKPPSGLSIEEWRNRTTMGRDHYVRVVYAGRLYPFGHRASLIKITERKFHPGNKGNAAFLRQRMFIVVQEPFVLTGATGLKNEKGESMNLMMPLKSARLTTLVTPNLDDPALHPSSVMKSAGPNPHSQSLFWPYVGGKPFPFHVQFEDETGALINTTAPLFFLGNELLNPNTGKIDESLADTLAGNYSDFEGFAPLRKLGFFGQRVQFAPLGADSKLGSTSFEVDAMVFRLCSISGKLVPGMASAFASVPALKHLARMQTAPELKYPDVFLRGPNNGFATTGQYKNVGEVFLELVNANATKMDFSTQGDRSGGFLAPNLAINALSRKLGPVGGTLSTVAGGNFDPDDFFGNLGDLLPKLFGCIKITDILSAVGLGDLTKVPKFISENLTAAEGLLNDIDRIADYLNQLSGQLSGLATQANTLANAVPTLTTAIGNLLGDPLSGAKRDAFKNAFAALSDAAKALRAGFGGLSVPDDNLQFAKTQLDQLLAKFSVGFEQANAAIQFADKIADTLEALNEQRIKFDWKPTISSWAIVNNPGPDDYIFEVQEPDNCFVISVELAAQSGASKEPSLDIACRLQKFNLNLIAPASFLRLKFNKIEFTASSREKPDVNVDFGGIEFIGVLSFIETLRSLIPLDGFSDPPALTISEEGIEASFSLALPNIAVGVFSLSNLALGAALTVPFLGQEPLSVRFNFCERSDPFRLTVWIFGGGGFFAVTVTPAGCQILEASFEFGACAALDFGVASGSVSVMAGIYFKIEADEASLTGYFNLKGRVSVLGLITASLELNLELTYEFSSGKCIGRASLIIEVEVLFFSASVEIECEKKFAGANGDPSFLQIMSPYTDPATGDAVEPWPEYCEAFAA